MLGFYKKPIIYHDLMMNELVIITNWYFLWFKIPGTENIRKIPCTKGRK
jgi:hypothetical protein